MMHVTLKDVALRAGVSIKTVSRVVNDQGEISAETRARVQSAIDELGYRPNILARSLVNQRTNTIAVVASGIEFYGPSRTIMGIEQQADEFGYSLSLNLLPHPHDPNIHSTLNELVSRRVEGIVWAVPEIGENRSWITASELQGLPPIVFLSMGTRPDLSIVAVDNRGGAEMATRHLVAGGRTRIGIITGPLTWWESRERAAGWRSALLDAGLTADAARNVEGDWTPKSGVSSMEQLLIQEPQLDAVFVSNDQMALGAMGVLERAGRRIPDDVALVGFDNIPESEFFMPPLTTVYQQVIELGRLAVQDLHSRIQVRRHADMVEQPATVQLAPVLVERASSGRKPQEALTK